MPIHPYAPTLRFIDRYWNQITWRFPKDKGIVIGLPNRFVSPNAHIFKNDQFYWDSYFTILALTATGRTQLARGMVDNFVYLFNRFHIIPSRNRYYNTGISQPPFLTSMMWEVFHHTKDRRFLRRLSDVAAQELKDVWMYPGPERPEIHQVYQGLSRYIDHFVTDLTAEHESGWDMTSRFDNRCLSYLPIDLNTLLYKYEIDLAAAYRLLEQAGKARRFQQAADRRRRTMHRLFWNNRSGFFFDYDWKQKRQSKFWSLAGVYPLWAGWATKTQAKQVRDNLVKHFETRHGLVNSRKLYLHKDFKQWDYPNGWPNQQWIAIRGLMNYGFESDARRIAKKWLDLNQRLFLRDKKMWEKFDVVKGDVGKSGHYATQYGFGWTNAVFVKLVQTFFPE